MVRITEEISRGQIRQYQLRFHTPYFFPAEADAWRRSFEEDIDGNGNRLFRELTVKAAYEEDRLIGFIQYGRTAIGFDDRGALSSDRSYCVIRNLYFDKNRPDAGELLLKEAMDAFAGDKQVYAFFHYFGMSCFARHGKLSEAHSHIQTLLKENGFVTEHENVYYSSVLTGEEKTEAEILPQGLTAGNQQYLDFLLLGQQVGGCEIHFVNEKTAYLRWIYINGDLTGKGIGTVCMKALKHWLYQKGIRRFDTDTALSNTAAQHYYEKTGFTREGITRSYYRV